MPRRSDACFASRDDNEQVDLDRRLDRLLSWAPVLACVLAVIELAGRARLAPDRAPVAGRAMSRVHFAGTGTSALTWSGVVIVVVLCAAGTLPLRFARPGAAAIVVSLCAVCSIVFYQVITAGGLVAVLLAGYLAGRYCRSWITAAVVMLPYLVLALVWSADAGSAGLATREAVLLLASLGPACAVLGVARRHSAAYAGAASQAIAGTVFSQLARAERARIARELHDVVAHHISMVAVQAETARLTTPGLPELGARRLREIGDTARAGLTEMRRLLGVLREDAAQAGPGSSAAGPLAFTPVDALVGAPVGAPVDAPVGAPAGPLAGAGSGSAGGARPAAERRPQPGLSLTQLNELTDAAREAAGVATRLIVSGPVTGLDPGVELAAYRIVQEALTNARRHAPGAAVDVELRYAPGALLVRVRDNGYGAGPASGGGLGLVGMRERAQAAGGSVRAGRAADGGFLVEATLPVPAHAVPAQAVPALPGPDGSGPDGPGPDGSRPDGSGPDQAGPDRVVPAGSAG